MNPQRVYSLLSRHRLSILQFVFPALLLALCVGGVVSSIAQSPKGEREIVDKIPAHLPIKVKVRNAEKVKDLENDDWLRDLEIEVKNTGSKPIYFLKLTLFFVDVQSPLGNQMGFPLEYGRHELLSIGNGSTPEDIPIQPGETYVLKYPAERIKGWNIYRGKHNKPQPRKIGLRFHVINYGDGTGFNTSEGLPVPRERSANAPCGGERDKGVSFTSADYIQPARPLRQLLASSTSL